jgi:serine/threonine-protein kinase
MRRLHVLLASVVIATLLIAVASGASAAPSTANYNHGALFVSPSLHNSYFASQSRGNWAVQAASAQCQRAATDCKPGVWVLNGYAAFAMDTNGAWGTGWGHTASGAVQGAQTGCRTVGGLTCNAIVRSYRTTRYNPDQATHGGIPGVPPPLTEALPPAVTGLGGAGTGQRS